MIHFRKLTLATLLLACAAPIAAQPPAPGAAIKPADAPPTEIGRSPAATFLMTEYGLSEAEAVERAGLQDEIVALSERLNADNDPNYADMWIEHTPVYKIVIAFADNADRKEFLASLDPKLQRYVQIRNASRSRAQVNADLDALLASFNATAVPYFGGYDVRTGKYAITAETQDGVARLRQATPARLRSEVLFKVGEIPKAQQSNPTGVQSGDWLASGYTIYSTAYAENCTFGFTVTYGSPVKRGILTAAHCKPGGIRSAHGHWVTYDAANPVAYGYTGKYDFMVVNTTGLNQDYQLYFEDKNSIPEFPATGFFNVTGMVTFMNQKAGMVMCKQGMSTGITCGEIVDGNALRNGARGWIAVSKTQQADLTAPGDSGGPWFMYPGSSQDIKATGVHSGATTENCVGTGSACTAVYMPIDYINHTGTGISGNSTIKLVTRP